MRHKKFVILAVLAALVAAELCLAAWIGSRGKVRNFHIVEKAILYGSGPLDADGWQRLGRQYRFKTVIDLREKPEGETSSAMQDEAARQFGFRIVHIPLAADEAPTPRQWRQFLGIVGDPLCWPVLMHCDDGNSSTGVMAGAYRIIFDRAQVKTLLADGEGYIYDPAAMPKVMEFWQYLAANRKAIIAAGSTSQPTSQAQSQPASSPATTPAPSSASAGAEGQQ